MTETATHNTRQPTQHQSLPAPAANSSCSSVTFSVTVRRESISSLHGASSWADRSSTAAISRKLFLGTTKVALCLAVSDPSSSDGIVRMKRLTMLKWFNTAFIFAFKSSVLTISILFCKAETAYSSRQRPNHTQQGRGAY